MSTFHQLRNEHQAVRERLTKLERAVHQLAEGQVSEATPVLRSWEAFVEKALKPHFALEEKTIIPVLAKSARDQWRALARELQEEHTYLLGCLERLKGLLQGVYESASFELEELCRATKEKLLAHAEKEDQLVIPVLREWLGLPEDAELPSHAPPSEYQE